MLQWGSDILCVSCNKTQEIRSPSTLKSRRPLISEDFAGDGPSKDNKDKSGQVDQQRESIKLLAATLDQVDTRTRIQAADIKAAVGHLKDLKQLTVMVCYRYLLLRLLSALAV